MHWWVYRLRNKKRDLLVAFLSVLKSRLMYLYTSAVSTAAPQFSDYKPPRGELSFCSLLKL